MSTFSSRISLFIVIVVLLVLVPFPSESKPALPITIWPEPTKTNWPNPTASPLSPHFEIQSSHPLLQPSISHYSTLILSHPYHPILPPSSAIITFSLFPPIITLSISISHPHSPLHHSVDESYSLSISSSSSVANLTSSTVWGAIHGLETFSQLIWGDPPVVATDIEIFDEPKFAHRGLMLDTSRNFYPKRDILRTIDAMAMNKLNVFHWHVTDAQSFAIVLPSERGLAEEGAYGEGMRYEVEDVREIVEYGLSRGVRVIPEIDMPAHTGSWAPAYPDIVTCADKFWLPDSNDWANRLASEPGTGHLNPLIPETYRVVHNVIRDVASLFPEPFFHAGADEITPGCWKDDPTIRSFLTNGGGTLSQLLETFISFTHPLIVSLNRTAVYWEDVLLDPIVNVDPSLLPKQTTILQTWNNGPRNTKRIVQAGYRAIVSSADFYYLDCGHGGFVGNDSQYDTVTSDDSGSTGGSWCAPFKTWQRVYDYDITYGLSKEEAKLVLGGEVALWSEQSDETVLDARLWPRASAMAEALWSGNQSNGKKKYAEATDRLNDWRDRMVGRGVGAEPIQPRWCRRNPGMCNLVQ